MTKVPPIFFCLLALMMLAVSTVQADDDRTVELSVVKNDNLVSICKRYLDNPAKWPEIGRINRLRDFDLIHTGQTLIIPVRLLRGVPLDGRVIFVKGETAVQTTQQGPWRPLQVNDAVQQGNLVRTGPESAVEIVFTDGTSLFLRPDTTLGFNTVQQRGGTHILQRLSLTVGRLLMKVRRATGQDSRIEIQTPSATAVARGTDFRVAVDGRQTTTSEVLQGGIDVEAMKMVVALGQGEGTLVSRGAPPLKPRKLLPPPLPLGLEPVYAKVPFALSFSPVEGARSYRFQLSKDPEGRDVILEKVIDAGRTLQLEALADGIYHLQGRSIDEIGLEGIPFTAQVVRVRVNPLPPFIQAPVDGARVKGKSVDFQWLKVGDAARYELQISPDREFRNPPGEAVDLAEVSREQIFGDFGSYYYRIRSQAADGYRGAWSDTAAFNLIPPPPSPAMEPPAAEGKELHIRWRDQGPQMTYHCQIARTGDFQSPLFDRKVERPEVTLPRPDEPGVYFVRTSTVDPTGYEGQFSPPQSFEIKPVQNVKDDAPLFGAVFLGLMGILALLLL